MSNCAITFLDGETVYATLTGFDVYLNPIFRFHAGFDATVELDKLAGVEFVTSIYGKVCRFGNKFDGIQIVDGCDPDAVLLDDSAFDRIKIIRLKDCNYNTSELFEQSNGTADVTRNIRDIVYEYIFDDGYLTGIKVYTGGFAFNLRVTDDNNVIPVWLCNGEVEDNGIPKIVRDNPPAALWKEITEEILSFTNIRQKESLFFTQLTRRILK